MNDNKQDEQFDKQIHVELDAGLTRLEPSIESRLREIRRRAVALPTRTAFFEGFFVRHQRLAGFASAIVLLIIISQWHPTRPTAMLDNQAEEMEMLTHQGSLDMYQDLDFYEWLAKNNEAH